jgi:diguanylate cyclase (GGDEF)-like protein
MGKARLQVTEHRPVLRVLLVDRTVEDARRVRKLLEGEPELRLHVARDLEEARGLLADGAFDAALVDAGIWADESAGLVACLREHRADVAVVLLTSGENEREALPALKLGAHDFVSRKNLEPIQLMTRIQGAVEESRTSRRRDTMVRWLEREARTDHLTGLYNRRAFDERLHEVCATAQKARIPVTVIMLNVTGTRMVNEVHGHDVGDSMIRRASAGIVRSVRGADFAARIGGDDFGIIIADADIDLGRRIARRIAHQIERLNNEEWGDQVPVAVTFGVASGVGAEPADLFAAGDQQLSARRPGPPVLARFEDWEDNDGPSVA